jgi:hypothetical protein
MESVSSNPKSVKVVSWFVNTLSTFMQNVGMWLARTYIVNHILTFPLSYGWVQKRPIITSATRSSGPDMIGLLRNKIRA